MKIKLAKVLLAVALGTSLILPSKISNANSAKAKIQIAILLDSSNSMDGLIDQTKTQLWKIVNALTNVTKDGQVPELQVALYEYGNDGIPSAEGFVSQLTGFTTELDLVSEKLFEIKTNGGEEYAGWVIRSAMKQLNWTNDDRDFHVVFIAGNEPFNQGTVDFRESVKEAVNKNALVNTIYCGEVENSERNLWSEAASLAKGSHFNINQDQKVVEISTPYDREISEWNIKLNDTYIPYGREGKEGQQRQNQQDLNATEQNISRVYSKVSSYYRNESWDLVDAIDLGSVKLEDIKNEDLPEVMRNMTQEQKYEYVAQQKTERSKIQAIVRDLYQKRDLYIQEKTKNTATEPTNTLDYVTIKALREQLAAKGFKLNVENPKGSPE
jgi:hypothetical protein